MNIVKRCLRAALPTPLRRFLHARRRAAVFGEALRRFLRDPEGSATPGSDVISNLIQGWDNVGWSALEEYLVACLRHARACRGPILECGSGLTTVLIGATAGVSGNTLWTLEHDPAWEEKVDGCLKRFHIGSVRLHVGPIRDYSDFSWYDPPLERMPDGFSLVICDGPPGGTRGGRYGLLPILKGKLKPGCVILLDDVAREEEWAIANRWAEELGTRPEKLGSDKPYARITVPEPG